MSTNYYTYDELKKRGWTEKEIAYIGPDVYIKASDLKLYAENRVKEREEMEARFTECGENYMERPMKIFLIEYEMTTAAINRILMNDTSDKLRFMVFNRLDKNKNVFPYDNSIEDQLIIESSAKAALNDLISQPLELSYGKRPLGLITLVTYPISNVLGAIARKNNRGYFLDVKRKQQVADRNVEQGLIAENYKIIEYYYQDLKDYASLLTVQCKVSGINDHPCHNIVFFDHFKQDDTQKYLDKLLQKALYYKVVSKYDSVMDDRYSLFTRSVNDETPYQLKKVKNEIIV